MCRCFRLSAYFLLVFLWGTSASSHAQSLSAQAAVSDVEVFVGEPFTLEIQVSGSDAPEQPDMSHMDGFEITFQGGSQNSSSSIQIINGQVTQNIRKGYIFSYQVIPLREGNLIIPAISVKSGTETALTRPISIKAIKPVETDDFKLRLILSKTSCYVGEPIVLTITWYMGSNVQSPVFTLPVMGQKEMFFIADPKSTPRPQTKYYRIPLGDEEVIAAAGQGELDGRPFTTLTFQKVLIPKKPGVVSIPPGTVSFKALTGYQRQQNPFGDDFFSQFFQNDPFGMGKRGVYKQRVIPSNALDLTVRDLPGEGRPSNFSGLVGEYRIEANAEPTTVNVGDPITLTIRISGPEYLEPVEMPPLSNMPDFIKDFKVPTDRSTGEISGTQKIFTQTIRPLHSYVTQIPPIQLSYFDTRTETYKTALTQAIPLSVTPTRIITANDAEGTDRPLTHARDVENWTAGIAHNYEDESVLAPQIIDPLEWFTSLRGILVMVMPPVFYGVLYIGVFLHRRRGSDPLTRRAKTAYSRLTKSLKSAAQHVNAPHDRMVMILEALKIYLGDILKIPSGALTYPDVHDRLLQKGVDSETLGTLQRIFSECEAARYGNTATTQSAEETLRITIDLAKKLEKIHK